MAQSKALYRAGQGPRRTFLLSAGPGKAQGGIRTHTATWARPCLPAAHFQQRHEEGRAVQTPGVCQMPPIAPCPPLSQPGGGGSACTCGSGCCIAYMSPGLRTARPCSPVRAAQPAPRLPSGSCYPNNNTQTPGTSMPWGRGRTGSSAQGSAPLSPRKHEATTQHWPLEEQRGREAKDRLRVTQCFQGEAQKSRCSQS